MRADCANSILIMSVTIIVAACSRDVGWRGAPGPGMRSGPGDALAVHYVITLSLHIILERVDKFTLLMFVL